MPASIIAVGIFCLLVTARAAACRRWPLRHTAAAERTMSTAKNTATTEVSGTAQRVGMCRIRSQNQG